MDRTFENARGGGRSKGLAERLCETPERRLQKRKGLMCIYGIIKLIVLSNEEKRKKIYMYSIVREKKCFHASRTTMRGRLACQVFFLDLVIFYFLKKKKKILCDDSAMLFVLSLSVL